MNLRPHLQRIALALLCMGGAQQLSAGDLTPETKAKILKVICTTSGQTKIACSDPAVKTALEAVGLIVESGSSIVWCSSPQEAKVQKQMGRLVVVGTRSLTAMACIVLEEDGGRPKIILNTNNIRGSRIQLSDALMKIGEKL